MEHADPQRSTIRNAVNTDEEDPNKWVDEVLDHKPDMDGMAPFGSQLDSVGCVGDVTWCTLGL